MENNTRKTIGIIIILIGAIILLSGLGLNLKFFAGGLETNPNIGDRGCYQESANIATSCGGLSTGKIYESFGVGSFPQIYDGNWDTNLMAGVTEVYITHINYTKPVGTLSSSLWQVKDNYAMANLSIPKSCWDYSPNTIAFKIIQFGDGAGNHIAYQCYANGGLITLRESPSGYIALYEEAMIWDINKTFQSICTEGREKCEGATSFICENNQFISKGKIVGKCGYTGSAISPELPAQETTTQPIAEAKRINLFLSIASILMIGTGIFMLVWRRK